VGLVKPEWQRRVYLEGQFQAFVLLGFFEEEFYIGGHIQARLSRGSVLRRSKFVVHGVLSNNCLKLSIFLDFRLAKAH
jgi:hypothetical protein